MTTWNVRLVPVLFVTVLVGSASFADTGVDDGHASLPARKFAVERYESQPPSFAAAANTLDPLSIVCTARDGYLSQMCEPWGMLPGLTPTLRFYFDDRILPWAQLKHHGVDGFDNNSRNLGAHALLREMLGPSASAKSVEEGQIGYLLGITDPDSGLPYNPDTLPRQCALGHGELAKNVMLYYQQTQDPVMRQWAEKMLRTLRRYAFVHNVDGVGMVAEYHQGGGGGQLGFVVGEPPVESASDTILGGWQHLYVGWNCWAFAQWNQLTGDRAALEFATALGNRLCHSSDPEGDDGSFRPDGSFGGKTGGSLHMHGHTHCLPGLVLLGEQLLAAGEREQGIEFIRQADNTFEWLYDASRNPDAGSLTGWLPEFLNVKSGGDRKGDCEGCTMGDVVQAATALAAASRLDPDLSDLVRYYDRAEQIYRGQVVESIFHPTKQYQELVRECLQKRVAKDMPSADAAAQAKEVEKRFNESMELAKRMDGRLLGLCGFGDWVNELPSSLDPELPGIDMMGCCADAVIRASHAIWKQTVTGDEAETRVNLAFNRTSPLVNVVSCLPHRGELNVVVKKARKVLIRVPAWAPKDQVAAYVDQSPLEPAWEGDYVAFNGVSSGQQLTVTYPLRIATVTETIYTDKHTEFKEQWRGNTIVDISPAGHWLPMYQRPQLNSDALP